MPEANFSGATINGPFQNGDGNIQYITYGASGADSSESTSFTKYFNTFATRALGKEVKSKQIHEAFDAKINENKEIFREFTVAKTTIEQYLNGKSARIQQWCVACVFAQVFHLNTEETNLFLASCGHPSLADKKAELEASPRLFNAKSPEAILLNTWGFTPKWMT